jgi:hypothetical protein
MLETVTFAPGKHVGPLSGNLTAAGPQGLESSIEPPELGGRSGGSLSAPKPWEKSWKRRGMMRNLIRIVVATCHSGLAQTIAQNDCFCAAEVEFQGSRGHTMASISQKGRQ